MVDAQAVGKDILARRDDPQAHKRLMVLATLNLVTAAVRNV